MTEQVDAVASLRDSRLLDVLAWAAPVAFEATDQIYDEDAGHDQGVVGYMNFKHLRDLIDRATSNERFRLGEDVDGASPDVLSRGITPSAYRTMPKLAPGAVERNNYKQSPGWSADGYRLLLQSYTFGEIDKIKWVQRSDAKARVASQIFNGGQALFDPADFGMEFVTGIPDDDAFTGITLVAAHAFSPATKRFEVYVGQSKNPLHSNDDCWHWKELVISDGTSPVGLGIATAPEMPGGAASTDVEDVAVRIKRSAVDGESGSSDA